MTAPLARAIESELGIKASTSEPDRIAYSRDLWPRHHLAVRAGELPGTKPLAVAWPETTEAVARLVAFSASRGVPVVPFGAGSGVCAAVRPSPEMLVVDLKRMRRTRMLDRERGVLSIEAGALGIRMEEELAGEGFTVGHFPSSILTSTVGGWLAARGAGQCSGKYGKIEDMVASLELVDGRGEVVTLKRRAHGPDLTPLVIGSEGVLGVVTAAELRLHAAPEHRAFLGLSFPRMRDGWEAIRRMLQEGLRPAVCRLYDPFDSLMARRSATTRARGREPADAPPGDAAGLKARIARALPGLGGVALKAALRAPGAIDALLRGLGDERLGGAMLILVFEGSREQNEHGRARAAAIGKEAGASDLGEEPARHWLSHRYSVSYRQAPMFMAGAFVDTMEVAAPWSRLEGLYDDVRAALGPRVFVMAHMSHAYPDGCSIYFTFAGSAATPEGCERVYDDAWRRALDAVIAAGATISHHHGVGRSKAPRLASELGSGIAVLERVRRALDPAGILNPGNLAPSTDAPRRGLAVSHPAAPVVRACDQLVHAPGFATLAAVEHAANACGLTLALGPIAGGSSTTPATTLAAWLAGGAVEAPDPWLDPADHLVAGFTARPSCGTAFTIAACPRRAVGPDLYALFHGTHERVGAIESAWLRVRPRDPRHQPFPQTTGIERDPPADERERALIDRVLSFQR